VESAFRNAKERLHLIYGQRAEITLENAAMTTSAP